MCVRVSLHALCNGEDVTWGQNKQINDGLNKESYFYNGGITKAKKSSLTSLSHIVFGEWREGRG